MSELGRCTVHAATAIALLAACGPSGSVTDTPDAGASTPDAGMAAMKLQPLSVGATWTYHVVDPTAGMGEQTITVQGFEDVGGMKPGQMAFKLHKSKIGGGYSDSWYEDLGTLVVIHHDKNVSAAGVTSDEEWYAPHRVRVDQTEAHLAMGATWVESIQKTNIDPLRGTVQSTERATWTVEAADELVTVPAGTFHCVRVRREAGLGPKTYWFADGVGKIKESGGQEETLVSYSVP